MDELRAFLTARVDELEQADWHVMDCPGMPWSEFGGHCCQVGLWLARDVAWKRSLIAEYWDGDPLSAEHSPDYYGGLWFALWGETLLWRDHPDFKPAWAQRT